LGVVLNKVPMETAGYYYYYESGEFSGNGDGRRLPEEKGLSRLWERVTSRKEQR
jgi:hypothetical protein